MTPFSESGNPYHIHGKKIDSIALASQGTGQQLFALIGTEALKWQINRNNPVSPLMDLIKLIDYYGMRP